MRLISITAAAALAAALALVPAATTAGPALTTKTIGTRGSVESISADGGRVAITTSLGKCAGASLWTPASDAVLRLPACSKDADAQYVGLALAGTRAAWWDYSAGNHTYCLGPFTATLAQPKPLDLGGCPAEPDNADLAWDFRGDGSLLVARGYTVCAASCEPDYERSYDASPVLYRVGAGRLQPLAKLVDDTKLLDVAGSSILVLEPGGRLVVLSAAGKRGTTVAARAQGGALGSGVIVSVSGRVLTVYDAATGAFQRTRTMVAGGTFRDLEGGLVAYATHAARGSGSGGGAAGESVLRVLRLADGRDRAVARVASLVGVQLEPAGLFYADNSGKGDKPGRVTFVPQAVVEQTLG